MIIVLQSFFYREDVEHALGAGMNRHLAKPVEAGSLLNALREFLIEE